MKTSIFIITYFFINTAFGQIFEVNWNDQFRKELTLSCKAGELLCEKTCDASSYCVISEGPCRDCIGTSVKMNYLISEIGNKIQNSGELASFQKMADILKENKFVTFTPQDVYNVIDASQSTRTYRKFEKMCPEGSTNQILFFLVDEYSREIIRPEFVYCDMFETTSFFKIKTSVEVDIELEGPLSRY